MSELGIRDDQAAVCRRFGVKPVAAPYDQKVGVARDTLLAELLPINALRHPAVGDTTGWYIWAGGPASTSPDFYQPMHVEHLADVCPQLVPYLALPPGWRVLLAPGHEDVWFDDELLRAES